MLTIIKIEKMRSITNRLFLLSLMLIMAYGANSQSYTFNGPWGDQGISLLKSDKAEVQILHSVHSFSMAQQEGGEPGELNVMLPGHFLGNDEGAPNLPGSGKYIAVPNGAEVVMEIIDIQKERYTDVKIGPAPQIPLDTENGPPVYVKDNEIYTRDSYYPEEPIKVSEKLNIRGIETVLLGITPFQYNPVSNELIVITDVKVRLKFVGGTGEFGENRLRSRHWDPLLHDLLLNIDQVPLIDYAKQSSNQNQRDTDGFEYLIIVPNDPVFSQWADTIKKFRVEEGITTGIVTLSEIGGNTTTAIESYIDNAYNTWDIPPTAVLLMADYGSSELNSITSPSYPHPYSGTYITDNTYADVDGDWLPDVFFARMTANNASQLEVYIEKFINYETNPPVDSGFYDHPITALGWQTERWFQICSEVVGGYFKNVLGKDPVRVNAVYIGDPSVDPWSTAINTSAVLDYFGPSGQGYIPTSPSTLGGWTGGTATDINNAINSGAFILQHRDHGGTTGWGEPSYTNTSINGLTNTDLSFIMSINCLTGQFNSSSECFTEKFHRYTYNGSGSGALGLIAASQVSYSFVNDTYVWGFYDYMWDDFMYDNTSNPLPRGLNPCFANAAGKYFLQQSNWPYNTSSKQITYNLFHHHGDAFLNIYSEIPQQLAVSCDSVITAGDSLFTVTADSTAFIALSYEGALLAVEQSDGTPSTLLFNAALIPNTHAKLVVTGRNFFRYTEDVFIAPADGPCIVLDQVTVIDTSFNSNGEMDYGETGSLEIEMMNVGSGTAENFWVSFQASDPWFTLLTDSIHVDSIQGGQSLVLSETAGFELDSNVPDGHGFDIYFTARVGISSWTTSESITCHSPQFIFGDVTVVDTLTGDGNGNIDPGETANLLIDLQNDGSCGSDSLSITIVCSNPGISFLSGSIRQAGIAPSGINTVVFEMSAATSIDPGTTVELVVTAADDRGPSTNDTLQISIGTKPVLIIDLDPNLSSGPEMETAMGNNGILADYVTTFPASGLENYFSVFVHLGIYSSNHVLTTDEGQQLADYLDQGGNLYMEGGDTWAYDSQTPVHSMFQINAIADGSSDMDTLTGIPGTAFEGLSFPYSGENNWMDRLGALDTAHIVLNNTSPVYGSAVIYNSGVYRTIGCSHEFGGLDEDSHTRDQLAGLYLRYFGIPISNEWLGNNSSWDDPANWSNGLVPDSNTHVLIPASPTRGHYPEENRSGDMNCKSLYVEPGAVFSIPSGSTMYIHN